MNKFVILSDIHANLTAIQAVMNHISSCYQPEGIALLGDLVDYGMRPNEVITNIASLNIPIICNLMGNHELAILDDSHLSHFSSDRGRESLLYTRKILTHKSLSYIKNEMNREGKTSIILDGKKILFIHGDMDNPYWGKLTTEKTSDIRYAEYDYVISGHTHIPHHIETLYASSNPAMRDKKRTTFINPGSVGQPRNHNPKAQYVYIDINAQIIHHNSVSYTINKEQELYPGTIDPFYKDRLEKGI